jgi:hypothetical protein
MYYRCKCGRLFILNGEPAFIQRYYSGNNYDSSLCEKCNKYLDDEYKAQCEADKAREEKVK